MKKLLLLITTALIAVSILGGCSDNSSSTEAYTTKPLDNLQKLLDDGYTLIDVREVSEFSAGHIPDAINVPLSDIQNGDYSALSKDKKYVVICRSGNRSATASDILANEGFTIVNLESGMSSWTGEVVQ